jgi:(2Fe-2S) ferredoxin
LEACRQVLVCQYTNCLSRGAAEVLAAFQAHPVAGTKIEASGCLGQCNMGPNAHILPDEIWYCRLKPEDVPAIATQHFKDGKPVESLLHPRFHPRF